MSRHRTIRNMKVEDVFADEYYYDENGNGDDDDEYSMTEVQKVQMKEGMKEVKSIIGQLDDINDEEIENTLWNYYFDVEKTISLLLDKVHKSQVRKQNNLQKKANSSNESTTTTTTKSNKAIKNNKDSNIKCFAFDQPSPDDEFMKTASLRKTGTTKEKQDATKATTKLRKKPNESSPIIEKGKDKGIDIGKDKGKDIGINKGIDKGGKASIVIQKEKGNENDDIIEVLDDDDDDDEKLKFDMEAQLRFDVGALGLNDLDESLTETGESIQEESPITTTPKQQDLPKTTKARKLSKRINVIEEYKKRTADKLSLNLVIIGHVDAGKSTLMGHLLYLLGEVNEKTMKKYERDSSKIGKSSFSFAWVLDETNEERTRGVTMDIAIMKFETPNRKFTLLDAPGHRDFIPNMISGAAQADVAILVVDSTTGEFEAGFDSNGQTKEHALLVRSLGVQQLIVAVNKLDVVDWSQFRFDEIVAKLKIFLNQANFRKNNVFYIPCSGLTGENLVKRDPKIMEWYNGPTLVQQLDNLEPPTRLLEEPFRLSVNDFFKGGIGNVGGVTVAGRMGGGTIQVGEEVIAIPGGETGVVKAIEINEVTCKWAAAGDSILITLTGLDIIQLKVGSILCLPSDPVPVTSHFQAQILTFDIKIPITRGFPVILHRQSLNEPAVIIKLESIIDRSTGNVTKKNPRHISKSTTAIVEIKLSNRSIPLETFEDNKELGRIMLRKGGETIAAGIVKKLITLGS
ncbi:hypothetical protein Glove_242g84 [Diversispora epigaea]|uniref:Elongation factor 1 alpha-like protein n=1 Tax=Diversispora epigaea TaxID=1348612 RepID=A0A397IHF7_9GLOM|nr:hypothetical protein Glove_242g84 [Diversispora epigaea]